MKIIKCFIFISLIIILLDPNIGSANSKELKIPSTIEFKLSNSEYNKYIRRAMRAYTDGEFYGKKNIKKKYKKWVKAKILIGDKKISSKIRILGDWKDHLRPPLTSLKVKTVDDSYFGVTRFNLFLPETRHAEHEVFWTLVLKKLKFPSLYTRMVEVNLNGNIYKAIFQEDATKEFLERNNITETVILKNNDFVFYLNEEENEIYKKLDLLSYVVDNNNFLKNDTSNFIASEAINKSHNSNFFDERIINENFFKEIHKKYAPHALAPVNRKYIYLPNKKFFLPLYYDGNIKFMPGKTNCDNKIDDKILSDFKIEYANLTNKKLGKLQSCAFSNIYSDSLNRLSNHYEFVNSYDQNQKQESIKYFQIKNKILNFLNKNNIDSLRSEKPSEKAILYTFMFDDKYFKCFEGIESQKIISCKQIDQITYAKYISESGKFVKTDNFKSFPINLGTFNKETPIIFINDQDEKNFHLSEEATYYFINKEIKRELVTFSFKNNKSKLFIQGKFDDVKFDFKTEFNKEKALPKEIARYDKNLLTGCVNFFDSDFKNVSIKSSGMNCEDSVNIKNSFGNIEKVEISNSKYDALDLDFSQISINDLFVDNAKNDCLDFSFGDYKIIQAKLDYCGDKGISVGERSKLNLTNATILNSKIGVASKDDAVTSINNVMIKNINTCLAAYNKKKEFQGSIIKVKNLNCDKYQTQLQTDNLSKILILK